MVFRYATFKLNSTNIILPILLGPAAWPATISFEKSKPVDPLATVNLVIPEQDTKYWPDLKDATKFPYTIQLPAISAAWMMNKTTNDKIQMGVDIALIALSAGEYAAAKGALQYIWVTAKIAVPLTNELLKTPTGVNIIKRLYGAEDKSFSEEERAKRAQKAVDFINLYNTFTNLVNIGAMGEGMYSMYKNVRGGVNDMKALGVTDETGTIGKLETDLNKIDDGMPNELKLGKLGSVLSAETAMAEKLAKKGLSKLVDDFNAMNSAAKTKFMEDFANASEDVLKALNKKDSELLESWKTFRKNHPNEVLCN
jgi:hypothetical protein